jgi:hypothetical protein
MINPEFSFCRHCRNLTVASENGRCEVCGSPKPVLRRQPLQHSPQHRGMVRTLQLAAFAVVIMLILLFIEWITKGTEFR